MEKPSYDLRWVRGGSEEIDFTKPSIYFGLGMRGSGKSSFLEMIGSKYLDAGGKVFDLFGAKDGEGLAWLRSPHVKNDGKRAILLRGDLVKINSDHENIAATKFRITDLDRGDIFISSSPLYTDMDDEFASVNGLLDVLWKRRRWTQPVLIIMREAANLIYSRLKIRKNQLLAKSECLYMMRESRHAGLAMALDSLRSMSIDIDLRSLVDYLVIKNLGMHSLPDDLEWVYRTINPPALRRIQPREFVMIDRRGSIGLGVFDMPGWHKVEKEDILAEVGLAVDYLVPGGRGDHVNGLIAEALQALPPEPEPTHVSEWIARERGVEVSHQVVGRHLGGLGYRTDSEFRDGKVRRFIRKNP